MRVAQHPLPLQLPQQFTHDGWVNHEGVTAACARLALWAVAGGMVWLRSTTVAGKSHLLHALAIEQTDRALLTVHADLDADSQQQSGGWLIQLDGHHWWLVDVAAGGLNHASQLALFHLIERAKQQAHPLVIAWRCDDAAISCPELRSRLRSFSQVEMSPPQDDTALLMVMQAELACMQWQLNAAVQRYLLRHTPRRLDLLLCTVHQLQLQSIARKMRPSLLNVRALLQADIAAGDSPS
ncbi:MAG: glucose-inhibited division protein A [Mariprofundales bacterium]|nr:glucose-inhibited division protein A [Mariprofundales bacterium]